MQQIGEFGGQPERMSSERSLYPAFFSLREETSILTRMQDKQRMRERRLTDTGHPGDTRNDHSASDLVGL